MSIKDNYRKFIGDSIFIVFGCILLAFATTSILQPNGLITGGFTGISIILDKLLNIKYTYIYYVFSVCVLLSTFLILGKKEALKIILISLLFPPILILFEALSIDFVENDLILASIYYGIIGGAGCGLILKRGFSMGGTDTVAKILHRRLFPFISMSQILLGIDTIIIISSSVIYNRNIALYAILTQVVFMKAIDTVLFGLGSKKVKMEIISCEHDRIIPYILNEVKRGISTFDIRGGYTNSSKVKIISICSPRESMLIKNFIAEVDHNAFVSVLPIVSVWGKGIGFESLIEEHNS